MINADAAIGAATFQHPARHQESEYTFPPLGAEDKLRNFQRPSIHPSGLSDPELQMMVPFAEMCMRGKVKHCCRDDQKVCDE